MSVNSVVELLGYDPYEYDVLGNEFDSIGLVAEKTMQPIKDKRLNFVDNNEADDGHLEYYSKKLAKQLNKLMKKLW